MSKGTVKYFNDDRGWGIIGSSESEQDVYVHHTSIDMDGFKTLRQGQRVLFDVILTDNGPQARNVRLSA